MKNWKTTATGIIAIITAVLGGASAVIAGHAPDWTAIIGAVIAGVGLIHAQDAAPTPKP
jgi:hypothetical protein